MSPIKRLYDLVPELSANLTQEKAFEFIADRIEALERELQYARNSNLLPVTANHLTSGEALRARKGYQNLQRTKELMKNYPGIIRYIDDTTQAFQDSVVFGSGEIKMRYGTFPGTKPCVHEYKLSSSEPGKTHWCALCGDRK